MCGIAGFFSNKHSIDSTTMQKIITSMTQSMAHRGPDAHGHFIDVAHGLALGHRRLSIRDLSPTGAQPMFTEEQRHCIVYNGEIYNAEELRHDLQTKGLSFSGTSDTEVVLKGCAYYGIENFVSRMIGMFAFAFWDREKQKLSIVRDRLGIKPVYYTCINGMWAFASELKALYHSPHWQGKINRNAVAQFLRYGYIHAPNSIYENTYKLLPGNILHIDLDGHGKYSIYWDAKEKMLQGQQNILQASEHELIEETHTLLKDAVKRRMVADVPLGAFLSGGIDSSLIAALMQSQSINKVRTFSIGFDEQGYNEAPFAKKIAEYLGTDHTEHYMSAKDAWNVIPKLASMYDEPFADSSQLPTYLLSAMTREHVTVALSGDGGDELFAGYSRYFYLDDQSPTTTKLWQLANTIFEKTPHKCIDFIGRLAPRHYSQNFRMRLDHLIKRHCTDYMDRYKRTCMTHWQDPKSLVINANEPKDIFADKDFFKKLSSRIAQMQAADSINYLSNDILVKVDRASMASSLEVRVPLLDHRVFEHAWKLPLQLKANGHIGKISLRKILAQYVPEYYFERPKMGFGVPIDHWLRGPLRDWAENLLEEKNMQNQGLLNIKYVQSAWQKHLDGENWAYLIWDVLMLQEFLSLNKEQITLS